MEEGRGMGQKLGRKRSAYEGEGLAGARGQESPAPRPRSRETLAGDERAGRQGL